MMRVHVEQNALATLAVQQRITSRYLLFDEQNSLCGRRNGIEGENEFVRPAAQAQPLAFSGIHVLSPLIFAKMEEGGAFSIIDAYLHLAAHDEKIVAFRADESYWLDLGRPEKILQAEQDIASGKYHES
jgi:NDP-sugar pyrophosphorylase family protein